MAHRVAFAAVVGVAASLAASVFVVRALAAEQSHHPDFTGRWAKGSMDPEFMSSGPLPLVNRHRAIDDPHVNGGGDPLPLMGDYTNPILKPAAAAAVRRAGEVSEGGRINPDPSNQCLPYQPPYGFTIQLGVQFVESKDELLMLYPQDDQIRRVRMNGKHPAKVRPSWMGDSVGHWNGDELVIDTVGVKVGPVTVADRYSSPQSPAMHVVERYRLIDVATAKEQMAFHERRAGRGAGAPGTGPYEPNDKVGLELVYTVEDPNVFTMPWSARNTFRRTTVPWSEQVCAENIVEYWPGMNKAVPIATKPDF
jgi:hypothetical protein